MRRVPEPVMREPSRALVLSAFAAVYVLWGSTYLAIRFTIETIPPFLMAGVRFAAAGAILYAWARWRGVARPTREEWQSSFLTGGLLFLGGNGAVVWAQQWVPSGVAALLVATEPMSLVLLDSLGRRSKPQRRILGGLALGFAGVAVLIGPGEILGGGRVHAAGALVLIFGAFSWAAGSLYSRGAKMPASPAMATALTLLGGGALLFVASLLRGEPFGFELAAVSTRSLLALLYLLTAGSLVGFTAYLWLMRVSTPARVATYAYVNPIIAVGLGALFAGEALTPRIGIAAAIIVGAVALIISARAHASEGETLPLSLQTAPGKTEREVRRAAV